VRATRSVLGLTEKECPVIFDVLTLFPGMFESVLSASILGRARAAGVLTVNLRNFREFGDGLHRKVDDSPYGGGPGMVLQPGPVTRAVRSVLAECGEPAPKLVMLTPQGRRFTQAEAAEYAALPRIVMLCGHYEGFDERIRLGFPWDEVSVGDYVLTCGELPAMTVIDSVARLLPGVLGDGESADEESFSEGLLEYPQYSRPPEFEGIKVPDILLSGHHAEIRKWRLEQSKQRTKERRPDLWAEWERKHGGDSEPRAKKK
jgi:tRNA (guanine37-N1)-methyltransferase